MQAGEGAILWLSSDMQQRSCHLGVTSEPMRPGIDLDVLMGWLSRTPKASSFKAAPLSRVPRHLPPEEVSEVISASRAAMAPQQEARKLVMWNNCVQGMLLGSRRNRKHDWQFGRGFSGWEDSSYYRECKCPVQAKTQLSLGASVIRAAEELGLAPPQAEARLDVGRCMGSSSSSTVCLNPWAWT